METIFDFVRIVAGSIAAMQRLLPATVIVIALTSAACTPSGYVYEVGNFVRPHPTQALCASRGQVLDMTIEDCVSVPCVRHQQAAYQLGLILRPASHSLHAEVVGLVRWPFLPHTRRA